MTTRRDDRDQRRAAAARRWSHAAACLGLAVLAAGCPPGYMGGKAEGIDAASSVGFVKSRAPVFEGQSGVAGDPSILQLGSEYHMFYTCATDMRIGAQAAITGEVFFHPAICQCLSSDGMSWRMPPGEGPVAGLVIRGRPGQWDENVETSCAFKVGAETILLYSGYRDVGTPAKGFPAALGAARSTNGRDFARVSDEPILRPTPGWHDNDAIYSPFVVEHDGGLAMIYVGHCYTQCNDRQGIFILGASSRDGITWTKREAPVLEPSPGISWMNEGVAEPALVACPDGTFYLFFTGVAGESRVLGMARGPSPFGPFEIERAPVLSPTRKTWDDGGVLAPFARIEGGRLRMWYMGIDRKEKPGIGYAEAPWPLPAR